MISFTIENFQNIKIIDIRQKKDIWQESLMWKTIEKFEYTFIADTIIHPFIKEII